MFWTDRESLIGYVIKIPIYFDVNVKKLKVCFTSAVKLGLLLINVTVSKLMAAVISQFHTSHDFGKSRWVGNNFDFSPVGVKSFEDRALDSLSYLNKAPLQTGLN